MTAPTKRCTCPEIPDPSTTSTSQPLTCTCCGAPLIIACAGCGEPLAFATTDTGRPTTLPAASVGQLVAREGGAIGVDHRQRVAAKEPAPVNRAGRVGGKIALTMRMGAAAQAKPAPSAPPTPRPPKPHVSWQPDPEGEAAARAIDEKKRMPAVADAESVEPPKEKKKRPRTVQPRYAAKPCRTCQREFVPTGPRAYYCHRPDCVEPSAEAQS